MGKGFRDILALLVRCGNTGCGIRKILLKNQHTQKKLLNFENWINGGLIFRIEILLKFHYSLVR